MILGVLKLASKAALKSAGRSSKSAFGKIGKNIAKIVTLATATKVTSSTKPKNTIHSTTEIKETSTPNKNTKNTNDKSRDNIKQDSNNQKIINDSTLNKLDSLLEINNELGPEGITKADKRQEILARQKFRDNSTKILEEIKDSIDNKESNDKEESISEDNNSGNEILPKKSFISRAIPGISQAMKSTNGKNIMTLVVLSISEIWGIIQEVLGDITDAGGFIPWLGKNIPILWNNINEMIQKDYGGWSSFIISQIKDTAEFILWISDKILEFLLGKNWKATKEFLKLQFGYFTEWWSKTGETFKAWWDYVQDIGVGQYILEKIKESSKDLLSLIVEDSTLKKLMDWWDEVQALGGISEYLKTTIPLYIQDWWVNFISHSSIKNIPMIGESLQKAFLGGQTIAEAKKSIDSRRAIVNKTISDYKEKEQENQKMRDKKTQKYDTKIKNINKTYVENKKDIRRQYDKNIVNVYYGKNKTQNSNNILRRSEKNHFTYEGNNAQSWMKVVTSKFGEKESFRNGKGHSGVDFRAPVGTEITSITDGIVDKIYDKPDREGLVISVKGRDGVRTLYMHLSKILVKKGDVIKRGQLIAKSGNSGQTVNGRPLAPHIHIQVKKDGKNIDPLVYVNSLNNSTKNTTIANNIQKNISIKRNKNTTNNTADNSSVLAAIDSVNKKVDEVRSRKVSSSIHETIRRG